MPATGSDPRFVKLFLALERVNDADGRALLDHNYVERVVHLAGGKEGLEDMRSDTEARFGSIAMFETGETGFLVAKNADTVWIQRGDGVESRPAKDLVQCFWPAGAQHSVSALRHQHGQADVAA